MREPRPFSLGNTDAPVSSPGEDRLAAIALGRTVAFLLYSLPTILFVMGAGLLGGIERLPPSWRDAAWIAALVCAEAPLLWSCARGRLPGTDGRNAEPVSERRIAVACHVLSAAAWVLGRGALESAIVQWVANGALVVSVGVYFVAKSVLAGRPRWGVASALALPALQLAIELLR